MKTRIIVTCAAAAASVVLSAPAANASTWKSCGEINFSGDGPVASSNYGVTKIRALRTGCASAKAVANDVQDAHDGRYSSHGFVCTGHDAGGGYSDYLCVKTRKDRDGLHDKVKFTTVGLG